MIVLQMGWKISLEKTWGLEDLEALSVLVPMSEKIQSWPLVRVMRKIQEI